MDLYWDKDNSPHSFHDVTVQTISEVSAGTRQIKVRQITKRKKDDKVWDDMKGGETQSAC